MMKTVKLCEVATISAGNSAPQEEKLFKDGAHNFVRTSDVGKIRKGIIFEARDKLNNEGILKLKIFPKGTILFPKSGASTFLNHRVMLGMDAYVSSHLATIKADNSKILDNYLFYILQTIDARNLVTDSAYPSLKTKTISEIKLVLPTIEAQHQTITILDAAFAEIDKLIFISRRKKIELNKLYISAVDKELLSDIGVNIVRLKEIAKIKGGKRIPKGKKLLNTSTKFPYIRVTDFNNKGTVNETSVKYISKDIQKEISRYTISTKDVYVSIAGTIGKTGVIPDSLNNANLTENAAKIVLDDECLRDYFYYFTTSKSFADQVLQQTHTSAQPKLALTRLGEVKFPLPSISIQKEKIDKIKSIQKYKNSLTDIAKKNIEHFKNFKLKFLSEKLNGEIA